MFTHAITRLPGKNFAQGLTTGNLSQPEYSLILEQHRQYRQALLSLCLDVMVLPAERAYPDAYFVEDPFLMTPQVAVLTNPGAASRQGEGLTLAPFIEYYRPIVSIQPPGTLEGGDVLVVGDHYFIGLSERTNAEGASQLGAILTREGFSFETVPVAAGLHLKSSISLVGDHTLLLTHELADYPGFTNYEKIVLAPDEALAANSLWVNGTVLMPKGFLKTHEQVSRLGLPIIELDVSEVQKMDGGLSCMSLRF